MTSPIWLAAASLVYWGWASGYGLLAALSAAALAASRLTEARLAVSPVHWARLMDLCLLLLVGETAIRLLTPGATRIGLDVLLHAPLHFFPLAAAQAFAPEAVNPRLLLHGLNRAVLGAVLGAAPEAEFASKPHCSLLWPYAALCLFAAGAGNDRGLFGFVLLCAAALAGLTVVRPRHGLWTARLFAFTTAALAAFALSGGVETLQDHVRDWVERHRADPFHSRTAIGRVGELKFSQRIVLRVKPDRVEAKPLLLRQAVYDFYSGEEWQAANIVFKSIAPEDAAKTSWRFVSRESVRSLVVTQFFPRPREMLSLPVGASRVSALPAKSVERNGLGSVMVEEAQGMAAYRVEYDPEADFDAPPIAVDLVVPQREKAALTSLAKRWGLDRLSVRDIPARMERGFAEEFRYSTFLPENKGNASPLAAFLTEHRSGHCEYFAAATALLARSVGVPSRCAVGWSVHELEADGSSYRVRQSHAHAWAQLFIDGAWIQADFTPPDWRLAEGPVESTLQSLADMLQNAFALFSEFRFLKRDAALRTVLLALLLPLGVFLVWRLTRAGGMRLRKPKPPAKPSPPPGFDSAFYGVEAALQVRLGRRPPSMSLKRWTAGIESPDLAAALELHYRLRFDPKGLDRSERDLLERVAEAALRFIKASAPPPSGAANSRGLPEAKS